MGIEDKNASNQILDTYIRNTGFFSRIWCVRRVTPMNMVYVGSLIGFEPFSTVSLCGSTSNMSSWSLVVAL